MALTTIDPALQNTQAQYTGFKNRIINGAMMIDQRNAGASVTANDSVFGVDRFRYSMTQSSKGTSQQNAGSVTTPAGFTNYLGFTSSSAYSLLSTDYFAIQHRIEGFNIADFAWGTANAKSITLSFWVYSSLTGTFGGNLNNGSNRFYVFSYSIPVANTWTQISITISGDTSGSWTTNNGIGLVVGFGLGVGSTYSGTAGSWGGTAYYSATGATSVVGTNGATFYITGVQLEKGSTATSFDYRPYGTELQLCQRYYEKSFDVYTAPSNGASGTTFGSNYGVNAYCSSNNSAAGGTLFFSVEKRASPTITLYGNNAGAWAFVNPTASTTVTWSTGVSITPSTHCCQVGNYAYNNTLYCFYGHWTASAEL